MLGQDGGQALATLGAGDAIQPGQIPVQHLAVEKQQCGQGMVLGGRGHAALGGQGGKKRLDLRRAHVDRVALAVEQDEALDPVAIGLLGAQAVVTGADGRAHLVEQPGLLNDRNGCRVCLDGFRHGAGSGMMFLC